MKFLPILLSKVTDTLLYFFYSQYFFNFLGTNHRFLTHILQVISKVSGIHMFRCRGRFYMIISAVNLHFADR